MHVYCNNTHLDFAFPIIQTCQLGGTKGQKLVDIFEAEASPSALGPKQRKSKLVLTFKNLFYFVAD